ncbi:MAG: 4Fe-4S binding protein [Desulfobacterales bacterium]|nr:4Fe-4S binding protein [Desulfobacterales bacterium]
MTATVYKQMLEVMTKRGGPYAGMDVPEFYALVEALFTPRQAEINNVLTRKPATAADIAGRIQKDEAQINAGNTIHTYDQVQTYIDKYDTICVGTCFCRQAARLRGESVHDMPMEVCFWFGKAGEFALERLGGRRLTRQEARNLLYETEAAGLIHMSRNTAEEIDFLCNCDRWHCEVVTEILKQPRPALVFNSGFGPVVDPERCVACETCIGRCPPAALKMGDQNAPVVDMDRCFGCAVCASGCPQDAILMEARPGWQAPPGSVKDLVTALKKNAAARQD